MKSRLFSRPPARPATLRITVQHTWLGSHITPVLVSAAMVGTLGSALTAQTFSDVAATTTTTPATSPTAPAIVPTAAPSASLSPTTSTTSPSSTTTSPSSTTTTVKPAPKPTTTTPKPVAKPVVKTTPKPAAPPPAPKPAAPPPAPKPAATTTKATTSSPSVATNSSYVQQVLQLTNAQRTANGCPALTWNSALASAAQGHSADMAIHAYFSHTTPSGVTFSQRILAAGYHFSMAAENIAAGQPNPQAVVTAWMNSPGHRANILNCSLRNIGIGYAALSGSPYYYYWTQDFGTP